MRYRALLLVAIVGIGAACSSGTENSDGVSRLRVLPADTTIPVFGTVAYHLVEINQNGDTVPGPAAVWLAEDSSVAGIAQDGTAGGRAPGFTRILAATSTGDTAAANLLVIAGGVDTTGNACYGIGKAKKFSGSVQWGFKAVDQLGESGFLVTADDNGNVNAEMPVVAPGPSVYVWAGPLSASSTASLFQRRTDQGTVVGTYTSTTGTVLPLPPPTGLPLLSLGVNLQTCTYFVLTGASVQTVRTENGSQTFAVEMIAEIQFAGTIPSDWKISGIHRTNGVMMANTLVYMATHPNEDVLGPLGYAPDLFGPTPASVQSSGGFSITFVE